MEGSDASADDSLRSTAEALKDTIGRDAKRLEIKHLGFAACGFRHGVFAGPKSLDAPEPRAEFGLRLRALSKRSWSAGFGR